MGQSTSIDPSDLLHSRGSRLGVPVLARFTVLMTPNRFEKQWGQCPMPDIAPCGGHHTHSSPPARDRFFPTQLAVESRVTSDDLQQAVSATEDKIVAVQSSVDSALSDRFRRMQDVVHEQARHGQ